MFLGGFLLYGVVAALSACYLLALLSPTRSSYGEAVTWLFALMIGLVFGFVGMCSSYYVYKKEYVGAAGISVGLTFLIVIAILTLLFQSR
ncbi:hypothetical protein ASF77_22790 [Massilia sp. Leaf139]|nr:hypothetical protein ASF77_22790 [Massilia sp. Leaf139]